MQPITEQLNKFKLALKLDINKQTTEDERTNQLNIIPNLQSFDQHPHYQQIVAAATQQTIVIYDLKKDQSEQILAKIDIPDNLIIQQIYFTTPTSYKCLVNKRHILIQQEQLQLLVLFKNQKFIHLIDFLKNKTYKLNFQENVIQIKTPRFGVKVDFKTQTDEVSDELYNQITVQNDVPGQYFFALTQEELTAVTILRQQQTDELVFKYCVTQLPVSGYVNTTGQQVNTSIQLPPLASAPQNIIFVQQGKVVYKVQYKIEKKQNENVYKNQQKVSVNQLKQYKNDIEKTIKDTFKLRSTDSHIDILTLMAYYNYQDQLQENNIIYQLQYSNDNFYLLSQQGVYMLGYNREQYTFGHVHAFLEFNTQQKVILYYKLNNQVIQQNTENEVQQSDQSGSSSFDIYSFQNESSQVQNKSILQEDEENSSADQLNQLQQQQDKLSDFDYFVYNAELLVNEQKFKLIKLLKNNFQLNKYFKQVYDTIKDEVNVQSLEQKQEFLQFEIGNKFLYFGQQIAFSENLLFVYMNPFTNVQVFDLNKIKQNVEQIINSKVERIKIFKSRTSLQLFHEGDIKCSRNVFKYVKIEGWKDMIVYSKGTSLMFIQQQE